MEQQPDITYPILISILVAMFLITLYFCFTLYRILERIPKEKHQFPSWFVWLFLLPWIGLIFQWIMLPFGIPNTLKNHFPDNETVVTKTNTLFKLGLAQVILMTAGFVVVRTPGEIIIGIAGIICWIFYWILIVRFRNQYLK